MQSLISDIPIRINIFSTQNIIKRHKQRANTCWFSVEKRESLSINQQSTHCIDYSIKVCNRNGKIVEKKTVSYHAIDFRFPSRWWRFSFVVNCHNSKLLKADVLNRSLMVFSFLLVFRRMLWINEKAHNCGWLGLGMVARHRCSETVAGSHDTQPDVRDGGNSSGRCTHCHWSRSSQNHEGDFF